MPNLIFQFCLKDIRVHVEDWNLTEREAIWLVKDFKAEHAHDQIEFYIGMVMEDKKTFEDLVQYLKNAFQSGETVSELITDFYIQAQKRHESKDIFANDPQILVWKIIAQKPEFGVDANEQLKKQYAHKLWDPYYMAIAHRTLEMSDRTESFTQSCGCLAMTFGGSSKLG